MRILYLIPGALSKGPKGPGVLLERQQHLQQRGGVDFEWKVREVPDGPCTIESIADEQACIPGALRVAHQAERDGFHAVVLGCFADPGLERARSTLRIPVVGAAESALHLACAMGTSYAILTVSDEVVPLIQKAVVGARLESRMAGIRTIGSSVLGVSDSREAILQRLIHAGEMALSADGADTLVLGCMSLAFLDLSTTLEEQLHVPVVCPLAAAMESAQRILRARFRGALMVDAMSRMHAAVD
jgi:allantoin racemase